MNTEYTPPSFHGDKLSFLTMLSHSFESYEVKNWYPHGEDLGGTEVTIYKGINDRAVPAMKIWFNIEGVFRHISMVK